MRIKALLVAAALALSAPSALAQSLEEMAGQMIVVGFQGNRAADASVVAMREALAEGRIGGVMYLRTNVSSLAAVREMNAAFAAASPVPPLITLDQEGGQVERLTRDVGFEEIPDAETVARRYDVEGATALYADLAARIAALGFTINFGPVADINTNTANRIIARYGRAFSADPAVVTDYDRAFIAGHEAAGLGTALKHFPGHGSSTADSHEGFVDITRTWDETELEPYRALLDEGYSGLVMVGHLYHSAYDPDDTGLPSSLSPEWIDGVLRADLGFGGVVISDDLEMGAIRDHYSLEETVVLAVSAGMDLLLFSNTAAYDPALGDRVRSILVERAEADPDFAARIEASYRRIMAFKSQLG